MRGNEENKGKGKNSIHVDYPEELLLSCSFVHSLIFWVVVFAIISISIVEIVAEVGVPR